MKHRESVKKQKLEESEKWKEVTCSKDKSHEDVLKLLEDLELMEELDDELDKLEVHDDESLKKLMSGESVPDSKKRISFSEAPSSKKDSKEIAVVAPKLTTEGNLESPGVVSLLKGYRGRIEEILKNVEKNDELLDFFLDLSNLKEEMDDDIDQLNSEEDEESESEDSEDYSEQISDKTAQPLKSLAPISGPATKNVKFSESFDVKMIESQNIVQDSGEDETTLHINVKHSKNVFKPNVNSADVVAHPADIYKKFQHCFNSTTTRKSILKRSISTEKDNVEKIESVDKQQVEKPVVKIFHGEVSISSFCWIFIKFLKFLFNDFRSLEKLSKEMIASWRIM